MTRFSPMAILSFSARSSSWRYSSLVTVPSFSLSPATERIFTVLEKLVTEASWFLVAAIRSKYALAAAKVTSSIDSMYCRRPLSYSFGSMSLSHLNWL